MVCSGSGDLDKPSGKEGQKVQALKQFVPEDVEKDLVRSRIEKDRNKIVFF